MRYVRSPFGGVLSISTNSSVAGRTALRIFRTWPGFSGRIAPILILILGRLPLWFIEQGDSTSALVQNAPFVLEHLMLYAMVGLVPIAIFSTILLPERLGSRRLWSFPLKIVEWLLFPLVMIFFGSLPATDAQTRLMLGKYLGFWSTEKGR
jgi:hypothetical protein